ncbi:MAG TPA: alanine--tRNA ligase, partial [Gemmatimonadales bacterium]|nr:alanine--tRNA ligase [Gemmatimonadales bacterium]
EVFAPLLERVGKLVGRPYDRTAPDRASYCVLADHARAVSFLLADGVYPANDGRGYVLRRILRRAVRHAWLLGRREPTLADLTGVVVEGLGHVYPELAEKADYIREVTLNEEQRFLETIEGGLERLEQLFAAGGNTIGGDEVFKLYDTFGFPIDLTQIIARERGFTVDTAGFERALEQQRKRSRSARTGAALDGAPAVHTPSSGKWRTVRRGRQRFVGYDVTEADSEVLAFRESGPELELRLRNNPFYAESGGQVSDTGKVEAGDWSLDVTSVRKDEKGTIVAGPAGDFEPGEVHAAVDAPRRRNIERNHSATHLVHHVLRRRLGTHVRQQGSLVQPDRFRFDFSHHGPIEAEVLQDIESEVNELILENEPVVTREMAYPDALALGAMAFFSEKYGDRVRVVQMGPSIELCGGTHVRTTGQVGVFRIAGQGGVAAGVRRIEAITGPAALAAVRQLEERLQQVAGALKAQPEHVVRRAEQLLEERQKLEARLQESLRDGTGGTPKGQTVAVNGVEVTVADTLSEDRNELGQVADAFRGGRQGGILVLFGSTGRGAVHVAVTDDLVQRGLRAGDLVNRIAAVSGGRGGGRPQFASAGAGDPALLGAARAATPGIVAEWLGTGS